MIQYGPLTIHDNWHIMISELYAIIISDFVVADMSDIREMSIIMNSFKFGSVVEGEFFTDRDQDVKELVYDILSGQSVVIISQRRLGKSSMVEKAVKQTGLSAIMIDLEIITDEMDLANTYTKKALSLSSVEKIKQYLKGFKFQPSINLNPATGAMDASFSISTAGSEKASAAILDSLELPETIAKDQKKRIVVVFDEFQEVRRISPLLERKMRGIFQQHHNVSYIFIGSQESMIREIFQDKKNPFYKFGRHKTLSKIPEKDMIAFVSERFKRAKIKADMGVIEGIMSITGYHPYYTQQLCYEISVVIQEKNKSDLTTDDIQDAQKRIITQHNADYRAWWNALTTTERKIVLGIASGMSEPSSQAFIQKYGIRSTSTALTAVGKLMEKGYLVRDNKSAMLAIEDPFWMDWIQVTRKQ
jgi:hypothetical protein